MKTNKTSGLGFLEVLLIIFIVLKLTKLISWSWFWVLSPIWIPLGIITILLIAISVKRLSK